MKLSLPLVTLALVCGLAPVSWAKPGDVQEATVLYKQGNKSEAQSRLTAYLSENPKDARARFLLGVIHAEQKRNAEALKIFTELTKDHPELPEPYNNLAVIHVVQGDYEKARAALEMAIRTHPSYAIAHENLGDVYATLASRAYDKALQIDSKNNAARDKLALIKDLVPKPAVAVAQLPPERSAPPPAAPVQPVKPVAPQTEPAAPKTNLSEEVLAAVHEWAKAWSSNDADRYLSFYAPEFHTPKGEPRAQWEASRRERLAKPNKIEVSVSAPRVQIVDAGHVTVAFRQHYQSDSLKASSGKTLGMIKEDNRWLIRRETVAK
ncbi:MAG: tetratricopeptide repeat protein [Betaproteobacteria bacterium]|nr:tetratricopeptide repeat protein [Betaproteobacteria bacterium]